MSHRRAPVAAFHGTLTTSSRNYSTRRLSSQDLKVSSLDCCSYATVVLGGVLAGGIRNLNPIGMSVGVRFDQSDSGLTFPDSLNQKDALLRAIQLAAKDTSWVACRWVSSTRIFAMRRVCSAL
jgi:hypothetical protein